MVRIRAEWCIESKRYGFETKYIPEQVAARQLEDVISSFCFSANQEIERLIKRKQANQL